MLTFLMSTLCTALSYAQQDQRPKATPEERGAKRLEMMKQSLNLTDEQVAKLQEVHKQLFGDMKQVRGRDEANREETKAKKDADSEEMKAKREEMKAKMEAYDEQLKTILTPEQYQKYQEQRKEMQKNSDKKMQKGGHGEHQKKQTENN